MMRGQVQRFPFLAVNPMQELVTELFKLINTYKFRLKWKPFTRFSNIISTNNMEKGNHNVTLFQPTTILSISVNILKLC